MQLIMLGAPGVGKGTQGKMLSVYYKIPNISTGDILRTAIEQGTELGTRAKIYMDKGELVADDVMIGLITQRLQQHDCENGFILDGFPRTVDQATALDDYLQTIEKEIDYIIALELVKEKIVERLTSRRVCRNCGKDYNIITNPPPPGNKCVVCGGEIIQRSDDTEETVLKRLKVYEEKTKPLKTYFQEKGKLKIFQADGSIEDIQNDIRLFLDFKNR
ncbi:MAG: adenylate kinase [bacterium]|nr:MAG: adenylate kinase [bacterium]